MQWVDGEGSAGSLDTSLSETSSNASHQSATVSLEVASVEDAGDDVEHGQGELRAYHGISLPQDEGEARIQVPEHHEDDSQAAHGAAASHEIEAEDSLHEANSEAPKAGDETSEDRALVKTLSYNSETSPLMGMTCSVCMSRPVQVALVPCGHSNLCRRCSRKIQRCPFCRKEIIRRQKLFLSG